MGTEKRFFLLITLLGLLPIFSGKYFPTLDGPAHLYNSQLISSLIFNTHVPISEYVAINSMFLPNWVGHFVLAFLVSFLPAFLAEKILLTAYVVALPFIFRKLILQINPAAFLTSYLIFPFVYTTMFLWGFYNFSIGIVISLLIFSNFINYRAQKRTIKKYLLLMFLFLILYFSHLVVFGITLMAIAFLFFHENFLTSHNKSFSNKLKYFLKDTWQLLIVAIIPCYFSIIYFQQGNAFYQLVFLEPIELVSGIFKMNFLIAFNESREGKSTIALFILLMILVFAIFRTGKKHFNQIVPIKSPSSNYWLFLSLILLTLYFILPDSFGGAGYLSMRLGMLFFLFFICWISSYTFKKPFMRLVIVIFLAFTFKLNYYYSKTVRQMNEEIPDIEKAAAFIPEGSKVFPVNFSDHWVKSHFSNYLGVDKPLIIIENYEIGVDYFPLTKNPNFELIHFSNDLFLSNIDKIFTCDYIFFFGEPRNAEEKRILTTVQSKSQIIYTNQGIYLFKLFN